MSLSESQKKEKKELNKYFNGIGQPNYSTPFEMTFTDGVNVFTEEPEGSFTSLNYLSKILKKITPSFYSKIMTKKQAVRFIRITEQYFIGNRMTNYTFILPDIFPFELTQSENSKKFLKRIQKRFDELRDVFNITEEDIMDDTPEILKINANSNNSNNSKGSTSTSSESVNLGKNKRPVKKTLKLVEPLLEPMAVQPAKEQVAVKPSKKAVAVEQVAVEQVAVEQVAVEQVALKPAKKQLH